MTKFDQELRTLPAWQGWEQKRSQKFAINHDGKLYPPKQIISLATGASVDTFSGGEPSNEYLANRGFEVVRVREARQEAPLRELIERILERGSEVFTPGAPASDQELKDAFDTIRELLTKSNPVEAHPNILVGSSCHTGRYAAVPWAALMDRRETTSTRNGVYGALLFRTDMSGAYLTFMQGVTALKEEYKRAAVHEAFRRSEELKPWARPLTKLGFSLDGVINLKTEKGEAPFYEAATIAHKLYLKDQVPSDAELQADIQALLEVYTAYVDAKFNGLAEPPEEEEETMAAPQLVRIAPGARARLWPECQTNSYIALEAGEVGDLGQYDTEEGIYTALKAQPGAASHPNSALQRQAEELWLFRSLRTGDKVVATRGASEVLAVGEVTSPYRWAPEGRHTAGVDWDTAAAKRLPRQKDWANTTVSLLEEKEWKLAAQPGPAIKPNPDPKAICEDFGKALTASSLSFGPGHDATVQTFIASLATKRFAILTGLSGSGKTQIALRFGEWLGKDRHKVVAVRPDWTGPEALMGYQDALKPPISGQPVWHVPPVLEFILQAAKAPEYPHVLILDEMNLAHVERYFADFLSGMESQAACIPNLTYYKDEAQEGWYRRPEDDAEIPMPENLFVIGTVNVDETTYMFSPKVLDRANTLEFRVSTDDLRESTGNKPVPCDPGDEAFVRGLLAIAADDSWQLDHPAPFQAAMGEHLAALHTLLGHYDLEFGHRSYYEMLRFASVFAAAGTPELDAALDRQVYQKVLPRLHGSRRKLEAPLRALGQFCFNLTYREGAQEFDPEKAEGAARLKLSAGKLKRMFKNLRINQFASFTG